MSSGEPKNKNLWGKVVSLLCVFQSLRKSKPQKYLQKTIINELWAKKRPILVQKGSSQPFLGIIEIRIMTNLILILAGASADASSDESAGTCSEMNLNIEFFDRVGTD